MHNQHHKVLLKQLFELLVSKGFCPKKFDIRRQMQPASCVLIMAGVYSTYSKWINIEIELAKSMNKKIIAIELWGSERTSAVVKNAADKIVRWNTDSIVSAIRGY